MNARWLPIGAIVKVPGEPDLRVTATVVDGVTVTERQVGARPLGLPGAAILDVEKARSATERIAEDPDAYHRTVLEEVEASVRYEQALEVLRSRTAGLSSAIREAGRDEVEVLTRRRDAMMTRRRTLRPADVDAVAEILGDSS